MGIFKAYGGLRALNYCRFASTNSDYSSPPYYKMNDSTPLTTVGLDVYSGAASYPFKTLKAFATADDIEDFDVNDYTITALGTTTCSVVRNSTSGSATATVSIAANAETTVKCIKFVSGDGWGAQVSGSWTRPTNIILAGYFFDEPIVLNAENNYSAEVVINFYSVV